MPSSGRSLPDAWTGERHRGVQLHKLADAARTWDEKYGQRAWMRRLEGGTVPREKEDRLIETIDRYNGKPFPTTPGLDAGWATGRIRRREVSRETIYCAELVAVTMQSMGLLGDNRPMRWYDPGKFWSGDEVELTRAVRARRRDLRGARLMRIANAPLSYGAFEMTVGTDFPVPEPARVIAAMAEAGYAGTELGPPGYLGPDDLGRPGARRRLRPDRVQRPGRGASRSCTRRSTCSATRARAPAVLCDAGGPERVANPGRGGEDASLRLDDARWRMLVDGDRARRRRVPASAASSPSFTTTRRRTSKAWRRSSACWPTPTSRSCSTARHLSSPAATRCRRCATGASGSRRSTSRTCASTCSRASRPTARTRLTAWRRGLFCALGQGDVDLAGFCGAVEALGYDGWVVVEQDRVLAGEADFDAAVADQVANRAWLREHAGW